MILEVEYPAKLIHIILIVLPPSYITHLNPEQWGAVAMNGLARTPNKVFGVQK